MSRRAGRDASVKIGSNLVAGMGNWTMDGYTVDLIDCTAFGDEDKVFDLGFGDAGTLTFSGNYDPDDATGQMLLETYGRSKGHITSLYLYIDNTSAYKADLTQDSSAYAIITKYRNVTMDATGVGKVSFTAKLSGRWSLY